MSGWGDRNDFTRKDEDQSSNNPVPQRKKLVLKPRSAQASTAATSGTRKSSNPFGAAKPREEVLAKKGIDAKLVDMRIAKKTTPVRLTAEQEAEVEKLRGELTNIEKDLREANEMELPEEKHRVAAEKKRKELTDLLAKFTKENAKDDNFTTETPQESKTNTQTRYERPSERRKRLEKQNVKGRGYGGDEQDQNDAYSSFGGRQNYTSY